jgi:hypothetical protein
LETSRTRTAKKIELTKMRSFGSKLAANCRNASRHELIQHHAPVFGLPTNPIAMSVSRLLAENSRSAKAFVGGIEVTMIDVITNFWLLTPLIQGIRILDPVGIRDDVAERFGWFRGKTRRVCGLLTLCGCAGKMRSRFSVHGVFVGLVRIDNPAPRPTCSWLNARSQQHRQGL